MISVASGDDRSKTASAIIRFGYSYTTIPNFSSYIFGTQKESTLPEKKKRNLLLYPSLGLFLYRLQELLRPQLKACVPPYLCTARMRISSAELHLAVKLFDLLKFFIPPHFFSLNFT